MYKVFIDNLPKTYQLDSENELLKVFDDHKFIEAAGGLVKRANAFLFIKRHGKWDIPKGKLEKGETVEQGAIRELQEECNLGELKIIDHLTDTWHTYPFNEAEKVIKKTYWFLLEESEPQDQLIPQEEEGITEVRFFSPDEFEEIKQNTFGSIHEVIDCLTQALNV